MRSRAPLGALLVASLYLMLGSPGQLAAAATATNDSTPPPRYELKFQADFDNSSIHKRAQQQQVFKCQVRLAPLNQAPAQANRTQPGVKWSLQYFSSSAGSVDAAAVRWPSNVSLEIGWLRDNQQLSAGAEPVVVHTVELHSGNPHRLDKRNRTRLDIKNTSNPSQLKLTSRLKISHLKPADAGQYKCLARASFLMPGARPSELIQVQQSLESQPIHLVVLGGRGANGSISRLAIDHGAAEAAAASGHDNNSKATISGRGPHGARRARPNVEPVVARSKPAEGLRAKWQGAPAADEENIFEDDEDLFKMAQQDKSRLINGLREQLQINGAGAGSGPDDFGADEEPASEHSPNELPADEFLSIPSDSLDTTNGSVTSAINSQHAAPDGAAKTERRRPEITSSDNYFPREALASTRLELVRLVHRLAGLSCYTGLGEHYHGNVSISADLRPCFSWLLFRHSQHLIYSSLTKLQDDKNHCRNPNADPRGPWCFVRYIEQLDGPRASAEPGRASTLTVSSTSQTGVRFIGRPCAVSPCSRFLWLYIVAPPLGLLLAISCLMMLIIRSIRKARYNTVFAASANRRQLSKFHQFFLATDRYPSKRLFESHTDKNKRDKYLEEDTFEIVDDLDWSDGQTQSLSPKSCQSLKLDSSFCSTGSQIGDLDSHLKVPAHTNTCKPQKTAFAAKALDQIHSGSGSIQGGNHDTSFHRTKMVEPMFATLRCMVRNNATKPHSNGFAALNNKPNIINECSTFRDQFAIKNDCRLDSSAASSISASQSNGRMLHKSPSSSHLISYSNTAEDINSMGVETTSRAFKTTDLPKLNGSDISIAADQQSIFEGMFSQVRYAYVNLSQAKTSITERIGSQVAVCSLKANAINDLPNFDMNELRLNHLNHLNILKLVGYIEASDESMTNSSKLCTSLVYDMSHLVDLSDWLKQQSQCTVTCEEPGQDPEVRRNLSCFAKQIALAIDYLHDMDIVFKDLACRNCFLDPTKMLVKLASFNTELVLTRADDKTQNLKSMIRPKYLLDYYVIDTRPSNSQLLPLSWVPLETILFNKFNKQTDVWSLGCLIYELFSLGEAAFFGYSSKQIIDSVRSNAMPPQPLLCPTGIYKLMCKCLSDIPSMRPDVKQIYEQLNLYSGQCSSFLDHHLCSLDTSLLGQPPPPPQAPQVERKVVGCARAWHANQSGSITKTKSHANLKCQPPADNYDTPLPLGPARHEPLAKIPLSRSINLTGSRPVRTKNSQAGDEANQYDEPLVGLEMKAGNK